MASRSFLALAFSSLLLAACGAGAQQGPITPLPPGAVSYKLPVLGKWRVHRTHYGAKNDQAYALDLVLDEPLPSGSNLRNSDYPSYNQPIVADAPGIVAIAVDGVPENAPNVANGYDMHGNFVVIDHQNGEYSLFAHFIPGTLRVRAGQPVLAGSELGRCGNSGHSTMPHLHWQVMTNASANLAKGIPPRLLPYDRNGMLTNQIPDKGDHLVTR
jgi:murein DD-endopeptidase MepM/ murein hydrolase activator NlpD